MCADNTADMTCVTKYSTALITIFLIVGLLIVFAVGIFCVIQCKKQSEQDVADLDTESITRGSYIENRKSLASLRRSTVQSLRENDELVIGKEYQNSVYDVPESLMEPYNIN